jgi:transposase
MVIIGIDIAKRSHQAIVMHQSGEVRGNAISFPNSNEGVFKLFDHIARHNPEQEELVFGIEATGHYWLALYSRLVSDGHTVHVINPIQSDSMRNLFIRPVKTDAVDAFLIAEVIRFGRFSKTSLAEPNLLALRQLCRYRLSLVDTISNLKRRMIAVMDQVFPEYETLFSDLFGQSSKELLTELTTPEEILAIDTDKLADLLSKSSRGRFGKSKAEEIQNVARHSFGIKLGVEALAFQIRQLITQIKFMEEQLRDLDSEIEDYYQGFQCTIDTIPGIGNILGAAILSEIGDISRFSGPEKLVAFAGIDPTVRQSGEFRGTQNRMSKRGSPYLRRAVWLAAITAAFHNPVMAEFYQKKRSEGKAHRTAIGAVSRKMLYVIYAMMKSGQTFSPQLKRNESENS